MSQRLVVCFDGTWNTPDEQRPEAEQVETNIRRIYESVLTKSADGQRQIPWYGEGVGTKWYERIHGGLFGYGLSKNILQGYEFLIKNYQEDDEIYVFGFSRGAYTARSLIGLIRNCGLLWTANRSLIEHAYQLYRRRDASADTPEAQAFRARYARAVRIKFLGVWDTVGALGIPVKAFKVLNQQFQFHDVQLSSIVDNAYHAVAIDEHRKEYDVTLWDPQAKPDQTLEQRWFLGAHSDVGGGYPSRQLSDITLQWMQQKAVTCGLAINPQHVPQITEPHYFGPITDSYSAFLNGVFKTVKTLKGEDRHYRVVCQTVHGNEVVDESAILRFNKDSNYRPQNTGFAEHVRLHSPILTQHTVLDEAA